MLKIDLNKFEPYHQIGVCYRQLREYEDSIIFLNKALEISLNAKSLYVLGNVHRENGQLEEAKKSFEKSISVNKEFTQSKLSIANLEIDNGNYDHASKLLDEIIQSNSSDQILISAQIMIGYILKSKGKFKKEAIKINKDILDKDPKNIDASYNISQCYLFTKEYEKAWFFSESRYDLQNLVLLKQIYESFNKPKWDLSRPKKNVLFYGEQGIGEQIIYSQFFETVKDQFDDSTIAVNEKLMPFLKKFADTKIINYKNIFEYSEYDYHLPMGSMGLYFQKNINQINLQKKISYFSD